MAEAPEAEAHDPAYTPDQARDRADRLASKLATTPAWPAISRAAHTLDLDALRRELAARVGVDTLVMGPEDEGLNMGRQDAFTARLRGHQRIDRLPAWWDGGSLSWLGRLIAEPPERDRRRNPCRPDRLRRITSGARGLAESRWSLKTTAHGRSSKRQSANCQYALICWQ